MRTFKVIGDDLLFDGQHVATLNAGIGFTLLDELTQFFDGLTLDVMPFDEADKLAAEARAEGHAEGLSEGYGKGHDDATDELQRLYDTGYREGYETGRRNGAA